MDWKERTGYILVKTEPGKTETIWKRFKEWDHTIGAWIVTGKWDVVCWLDTNNMDQMHKWAQDVRNWDGVWTTSSHLVYSGSKNGHWWWEKDSGAWVAINDAKLNGNWKKLANWEWVTSLTSLPGNWDYVAWVSGKDWNEVWNNVWQISNSGMKTETWVPIKSYWNKDWQNKWW